MEEIRNKIRKLLRLARDKGANENEAANALAMASRLMLEHNINQIDDEEEVKAIKGEWMGIDWVTDKWHILIGTAVAYLFSCRFVYATKFGDAYFVGRAENIEACMDTMSWVHDQIEEFYKLELKRYGQKLNKTLRAELRLTFKEACALRVFQRVGEIVMQNRGEIPSHLSLVVIDQSLAAADDLCADISKGKDIVIKKTGIGTGAGRAAGDAVQLQDMVRKS